MPKKHRLTRADFSSIKRASSKRLHGAYVSLQISPLPDSAVARSACVISKKLAPRAVDRNRIERRVREAVRPGIDAIRKPFALVWHVKREALAATPEDFERDVRALLLRATMPEL